MKELTNEMIAEMVGFTYIKTAEGDKLWTAPNEDHYSILQLYGNDFKIDFLHSMDACLKWITPLCRHIEIYHGQFGWIVSVSKSMRHGPQLSKAFCYAFYSYFKEAK